MSRIIAQRALNTRTIVLISVVLAVSVAVAASLSLQRSSASFTATEIATADVTAGTVVIDLDTGEPYTVAYAAENVAPGWDDTIDVRVNNQSTVEAPTNLVDLRLYYTGTDPTHSLQQAIDVYIVATVYDENDAIFDTQEAVAIYDGTWAALEPDNYDTASGLDVENGGYTVYTVTLSLDAETGNEAAEDGGTGELSLMFEARNLVD